MNKEQKQNYIKNMTAEFENSEAVLVTHYQGLTVKQLDDIRKHMREHGIKFQITKNRITKLALKNSKCKNLTDLFTGPTAVALSKDAITSAKILTKFSKENKSLKILGGIMGEEVLDVAGVAKVASITSGKLSLWAILEILGRSDTSKPGFPIDSQKTSFVFS